MKEIKFRISEAELLEFAGTTSLQEAIKILEVSHQIDRMAIQHSKTLYTLHQYNQRDLQILGRYRKIADVWRHANQQVRAKAQRDGVYKPSFHLNKRNKARRVLLYMQHNFDVCRKLYE